MKVLFYHYGSEDWFGITYLSAALKKAGHKTDLLLEPPMDLYFKVPLISRINVKKRLVKKALGYKPDLIAFSTTTNAFPHVRKMASLLKYALNAPIIIGGVHATSLPEYVLNNSAADMVCRGEGDEAIVEVADALEAGRGLDKIRNIWVKKKDGSIVKNDVRPLIEDLDSLPFPDKELFARYNCISSDYNIIAGRGCPYSCSYCCNHYYQQLYRGKGRYVRMRSPENVVAELKLARKRFKIRSVYFWDDAFTVNMKWLRNFTKLYRQEVALPFHCLTRPENINQEVISLLKAAGCSHINIGIESGSERVRRQVLNRQMTNRQIIDAARLIRKAGIRLNVFNMFGIPDETPEEMWETVRLNLRLKADGVFAFLLNPFPETRITDYALSKGLLSDPGLERVKSGNIAGFQSEGDSSLEHPHKELARNLKTLLPIMNRSPRFMQPMLRRLALSNRNPGRLVHIASLFFVDPSRTGFKIKEYVSSVVNIMRLK